MENSQKKLLLIGCGKLGTILLKSWLQNNTFHQIIVIQPSLSSLKSFDNFPNLHFLENHSLIPNNFTPDIIAIAAKPNQLSDILPNYSQYQSSSLFISLATSIPLLHLQKNLGPQANIVRLMPNIAIQVGQSVNLAYSSPSLPSTFKDLTQQIFTHTGQLFWLDNEKLLDILTPISGSGPAYFFLLTEILSNSISKKGLSKETSLTIANQILLGSALLTTHNPNLQQLRSSVTSKGGITEAALKILQPHLPSLIDKALDAAMNRLIELKP